MCPACHKKFEDQKLAGCISEVSSKVSWKNCSIKVDDVALNKQRKWKSISHALNYGSSWRKGTGRSQEIIALVKWVLEFNQQISCRKNYSELPPAIFFRIFKLDLKLQPFKIFRRHDLTPIDFSRKLKFFQWLLEQYNYFLTKLLIGDEGVFWIDRKVNTQNSGRNAPQKHPSIFRFNNSYGRAKSYLSGLCCVEIVWFWNKFSYGKL